MCRFPTDVQSSAGLPEQCQIEDTEPPTIEFSVFRRKPGWFYHAQTWVELQSALLSYESASLKQTQRALSAMGPTFSLPAIDPDMRDATILCISVFLSPISNRTPSSGLVNSF